jgi:hypothetical protein
MPKPGAGLHGRVANLERVVRTWPVPGRFAVVKAVPVHDAKGLPCGLHPAGGSTATLVFDPAAGDPVMHVGRVADHGLMIVLGPERVERPF